MLTSVRFNKTECRNDVLHIHRCVNEDPSILLFLLWSLVEVHSQTVSYVSFMGETLLNHAYVDLSLVGNDGSGSDSVQCHTDLDSCCIGAQGDHRGDWFPPDSEMRVPFPIVSNVDIYAVLWTSEI